MRRPPPLAHLIFITVITVEQGLLCTVFIYCIHITQAPNVYLFPSVKWCGKILHIIMVKEIVFIFLYSVFYITFSYLFVSCTQHSMYIFLHYESVYLDFSTYLIILEDLILTF